MANSPMCHTCTPRLNSAVSMLMAFFCMLVLSACTPSIHDLVGNAPAEEVKTLLEKHPERVHDINPLGQGPLHYAVMYKRMDLMPLLLEKGADIDLADNTGMTPLHVTALYGRREATRWLLDQGASLEALDMFGDTPVHTAAAFDQGGVLKVLIDAGAALDPKNKAGKTPLELAQHYDRDRTAQYIQKLKS